MNTLTPGAERPTLALPDEGFKRLDALPACWQWKTESNAAPPQALMLIPREINANTALQWARQNIAMVWLCDFQNAKQLLVALQKRLEPRPSKKPAQPTGSDTLASTAQAFQVQRLHRSQQLNLLNKLLIPVRVDYTIGLNRAPAVQDALSAVWGPSAAVPPADALPLEQTPLMLLSLKELLGYIGAHEWRKKGLPIRALMKDPSPQFGTHEPEREAPRIHAHYGVFAPVRGEYLELVKTAPLPSALQTHSSAQDVGVGTGVLSAILLSRGIERVIATDTQERALLCAADNFQRLGLTDRVQLLHTSLFADETSALIVCNPPWLPGKARSPLERAVFDPESAMLKGFLNGLSAHLTAHGEGWLIMSDLAERLGLRAPGELAHWIEAAGLEVVGRLQAPATHPKSADTHDAFYQARHREITSLWRLQSRAGAPPPHPHVQSF